MAKIDVAVPNYQYGRFLRDCVSSVLSQGIDDLRVLIIDNASTDESVEIAQQLAAEDPRVGFVRHPTNLGHHASFNEAIEWAASDYFVLLCADDLLTPGSLARAASFLDGHRDANMTFGHRLVVRADIPLPTLAGDPGEPRWRVHSGRDVLVRFCRTGINHIAGPTVMVRTAAQKAAGFYRPALTNTDDFEMWMRLACLGSVGETDALQGIQRAHAASRSESIPGYEWDLRFDAAFESFFKHEGALAPAAHGLYRIARRNLSERNYWRAVATLLRGDTRFAFELFRFAVTRAPETLVLPPLGYFVRHRDGVSHAVSVLAEALAHHAWGRRHKRTDVAGSGKHSSRRAG